MKSYSIVGLAVAATLLTGNAVAQQSGQLEEVVVTATKREQTLQDVPVAVTVTTAETLEKASIRDVADLASIVPSLRVSQLQTSTNTNFIIRGFGNGANNPGIEPSVGVFVDGVYRSRSAGSIGDLVDVQRVEVLRGPQSTLFGQNASAGVISVVTKKPDFEWGGMVEATLGNYDERSFKGKLTGPISDTVAFSVAGSVNSRDGYFINLANNAKLNDRDRWDLRAQLLWNASDSTSVRLIADKSSIDELCCGVSNLLNGPTGALVQSPAFGNGRIYPGTANSPGLPFDRKAFLNKNPRNGVDNDGLSLHIDWEGESVSLASITALRNQKTDFDYDFDFTGADLGRTNRNIGDIESISQELRASFDAGGAVRGLVGAYYITEKVKYDNIIEFGSNMRGYANGLTFASSGNAAALAGLEAALGLPTNTFFAANTGSSIFTKQDSDAYTLFGQLEFDLGERASVLAGIAYTNTQKDIDFQQTNTDRFAQLDLVQIGFAQIFQTLTGQPATPANLANPAYATAASAADRLSVTPCSAATGSACNSALGLYPLQFLHPVVPFTDKSDDSKVTYTVRLSFDVTENINAYAGVSTGYKATSWNLSRDSKQPQGTANPRSPLGGFANPYYPRFGTRQAGPEESTVYEIGLKGRWPRAAVYVALFDQNIKGFQENTFRGTGFVLSNAGKQSSQGIEIETQFKISDNWRVDLAATVLDPVFDSYVGAPSPCSGRSIDRSGQRPLNIHDLSLSAGIQYSWTMGETDGFVRADYDYEDNTLVNQHEQATSVCSTPLPSNTFDTYRQVNTVNASAGFSRDGWDFMIWGRNLTNDEYLVQSFPSVAQQFSVSGYPNQPRTYGLTVRKNF
ncbi:MAG: TonB-dependent receptor [Gammaproteobacteria bacterium]|jgi:iron complex outermembrane receptor protein